MHSEFYTAAQNDFVLVSLDFPQGEEAKAAVPNPQRNDELMAKYGVQGFPTVMIVSAAGEAYGQTGYKDLDPADYLADVATIRDTGKKALVAVRELEAEFAAAEDKVAVAVRAAGELSEMEAGSPAIAGYAAIARQGIALTQEPAVKIDLLRAAVMATGATEDDIKLAEETLNNKGKFEIWHTVEAINKKGIVCARAKMLVYLRDDKKKENLGF